MRRLTPEEGRKLRDLVQRRSTPCNRCHQPVVWAHTTADDVLLDSWPHRRGTHVLVPGDKPSELYALDLARLTPAQVGLTVDLEAFTLHRRSCGRPIKPPFQFELQAAMDKLGALPMAPIQRRAGELVVGDVVLGMVAAVEADSPLRPPAKVTAITGDEVHFDRQRQPIGDTARFDVALTMDTVTEAELQRALEVRPLIQAAGCRCRPAPIVEWHGARARCQWCRKVAGDAPPSTERRRSFIPTDPRHIGEGLPRP